MMYKAVLITQCAVLLRSYNDVHQRVEQHAAELCCEFGNRTESFSEL